MLRLIIVCLVLLAPFVYGKQLSFEREGSRLSYTWLDFDNTKLSTTVDFSGVPTAFRTFRAYSPAQVEQYIHRKIMLQAKNLDPKKVRIKLVRKGSEKVFFIEGQDQKVVNQTRLELSKQQEILFQEYLQTNNYIEFKDFWNTKKVKPDHVKIALLSQNELKPLAQAFQQILDSKSRDQAIDILLGFIQSVPYSKLQSKDNRRGAGYLPPRNLLINNRGDCDSKVTLMASILSLLYPDTKLVMVLIPNHALLGIQNTYQAHGETIRVDGIEYLLVEPTGPAQFKLGEIDEASLNAIAKGLIITEAFETANSLQ